MDKCKHGFDKDFICVERNGEISHVHHTELEELIGMENLQIMLEGMELASKTGSPWHKKGDEKWEQTGSA